LLAAASATPCLSQSEPIRLNVPDPVESTEETGPVFGEDGRRGFDYEAFDARLESLWFARKAHLAAGRDEEARRQGDLLLAFAREEGVRRLENVAGALVTEAHRFVDEGSYDRALASLDLAEALDPGRPQTHLARAAVLWKSGRGVLGAVGQAMAACKASVLRAWTNLTLVQYLALVLVLGMVGALSAFAVLMAVRHHVAFRHDIEEWMTRRGHPGLAGAAGWGVLLLPLLTWVGAGWLLLYWIPATYRYLRRAEKVAAALLLLVAAAAMPAYRVAVGLYGVLADPAVRTTLAAASGSYEPDRVLELQALVEAHPTDATYRFLLANLYKSGHFFEDAYEEYQGALRVEPGLYQARINIGNVFFLAGRHAEAVVEYRKALDLNPRSALAWYNTYLAQQQSFHLRESEESLRRARSLDGKGIASLLAQRGKEGDRAAVVDAAVGLGSVWRAALAGGPMRPGAVPSARAELALWWNPLTAASLLALAACAVLAFGSRQQPARPCIRCGRPFCSACKSHREAHEYCSQCVHLFVLGDGLAPQTKMRKMYEVERHDRRTRRWRRLGSLLLPGSAQLLRGRTLAGVVLLVLWLAALIAWQPGILIPVERLVGTQLRLDLLRSGTVPGVYGLDPSGVLALVAAVLTWLLANISALRVREG
jgi:tetratricopeptide (TPR) repeat protein